MVPGRLDILRTVEPALAYAPGIRVALDAARDARGVIVGLDALIDLGLRPRQAPAVEAPVDEGAAPGQVARTQEELTEIFRSGAWRDETAAKARTAFRRRFCEYDDGRAAERVVRRVFLGEPEDALPPVLPIEDRTPAPTPEEATA